MSDKIVYFKSFEAFQGALSTCTSTPSDGGFAKGRCQSLDEVLQSGLILPNTVHSLKRKRLCTSVPSSSYPETYRPEGIAFRVEDAAAEFYPVDLMALTYGKAFTSSDYGASFFPGWEEMGFEDYVSMLEHFPNFDLALKRLNELRTAAGLARLSKKKLGAYNEACFYTPRIIVPVALVGTSSEIHELSFRYGVPLLLREEIALMNEV